MKAAKSYRLKYDWQLLNFYHTQYSYILDSQLQLAITCFPFGVIICDRAWENWSSLHVKFDLILRVYNVITCNQYCI